MELASRNVNAAWLLFFHFSLPPSEGLYGKNRHQNVTKVTPIGFSR
jgi:hypothetical protein